MVHHLIQTTNEQKSGPWAAFFDPGAAQRSAAQLLTAILALAIFTLALIPLPAPRLVPGTDKLHHLIAFAALTLPCAALWPRALLWVLPIIVLEAGLIEIVQPYVNRMREWADFMADLKGVAIGLILGLTLHQTRKLALICRFFKCFACETFQPGNPK